MTLFIAYNGAMPTTAALAGVTTGTAIKTMLQVATPATRAIKAIRWGITFTTAPTAPVTCELIQTDVAATVTAHAASGVQPYDDPTAAAVSAMTLGTSATGYTATAEGSITATRYGDYRVVPIGASNDSYEWTLAREWAVPVSKFVRIRCTTSAAVSAVVWLTWAE